jgi:excisionase family DNA binding protein
MQDRNGHPIRNVGGRALEPLPAEWLGLRQVARYVSISERTLRGWIRSPVDPLPAVRVCGKILVRRSELDAWLSKHRVKSLETVDIDGILKDTLQVLRYGR